jgi:hypothetical protein
MADAPQNARAAGNWRFPLISGLSMGLALPVAWNVERALEPGMNSWAAGALGILAAGVGGGVVAFVVSWLTRQRKAPGPADLATTLPR